jgi:uncharacterized small protein (DUF1192 family)
MDNTKLFNEYVSTLGELYKNAMMEKVMLSTQVKLLTEEIERLKKELEGKENSL